MARRKQAAPLQREPSGFEKGPPESPDHGWRQSHGNGQTLKPSIANRPSEPEKLPPSMIDQAGPLQLVICAGGIYAAFLSWAVLQERIMTTTYGPPSSSARFTQVIFLNTIQSTFAAISGYLYLLVSNRRSRSLPAIFPTKSIIFPLVLVATTSTLASPFGYTALKHVDYITFILAKSCKLLPVMFLHLTIFRKRYPLYKYLVVALVTAGVAVFTFHSSKAKSSSAMKSNSAWGLLLLSINLLFDGLTNSTQDHIFSTHRAYSGPQMMVAQNLLATVLTVSYLSVSPYLPHIISFSPNELSSAMSFIRLHPAVGTDIFCFGLCGAIGQIFIFYTLSQFSSLLLVTVTVTRKMLSMVLSVVWFGHKLSGMQWVGVGLVFGGVGAEGWIARSEKAAKEKAKREKQG